MRKNGTSGCLRLRGEETVTTANGRLFYTLARNMCNELMGNIVVEINKNNGNAFQTHDVSGNVDWEDEIQDSDK